MKKNVQRTATNEELQQAVLKLADSVQLLIQANRGLAQLVENLDGRVKELEGGDQ